MKKFCGIFNVEAGNSVQYFCSNENADQSMLKEVQVKGDGNCFFRCISMYLFGTEGFHNAIRREVVNEMRKYPARYKEHLESMKKCNGNFSTRATEAEIYAVANILGCDVYVLHPEVTQREMNRYSPNRSGRKENFKIVLTYANNHFNLLALPQDKCTCQLHFASNLQETENIDWWDCPPVASTRLQTTLNKKNVNRITNSGRCRGWPHTSITGHTVRRQ